MSQLTIDDLIDIMRECAGEDESVALDRGNAEAGFADLGYDSLALLETGAVIERRFGIKLDDTVITSVTTPSELVAVVNEQLAGVA